MVRCYITGCNTTARYLDSLCRELYLSTIRMESDPNWGGETLFYSKDKSDIWRWLSPARTAGHVSWDHSAPLPGCPHHHIFGDADVQDRGPSPCADPVS